jgi:hypothetical protein
MGIYPNHGIEYMFEFKLGDSPAADIETIIEYIFNTYHYKLIYIHHDIVFLLRILSQHQTDDRLIKSKYYLDRKDTWFSYEGSGYEYIKKINNDPDIKLSDTEKNIIEYISNNCKSSYHGWYEVNTITTSYDDFVGC